MRVRAGGELVTSLEGMIRALKDVGGPEAVAVINRDGGVVAATLPEGVSQETFSIMCAAILGAGMTAATELHHAAPARVILESRDATILIEEIGRRAMLVLVVPPERSPESRPRASPRFGTRPRREPSWSGLGRRHGGSAAGGAE